VALVVGHEGVEPRPELVVGQDEERGDELRVIEFERIAGGKAFDTSAPWFTGLLRELGQA
jgi:pyrophosphate--fructose-6-phosphate 1-phosphotransferase